MVERVLSWALRSGLRKGVAGGQNGWVVIAAAAGVVKYVRRPAKNSGGSIRLDLKPGESYVITCSDDLSVR